VLAHRDSPYTGMTWVASPSNNFLQLRFFDKVEGGVCLAPTWTEVAALVPHLAPAGRPPAPAVDPGTLNNSAYISLFPAGILLNRTVPAAPKALVVGLGSGVGIAQLAHHFPGIAIEVVDIDPAVIEMVRAHYPLLAWLEQQRRPDGEPRLRFVARDARAHIRASRGRGFDLVVLDAYTAGSTIPPHLMTREFFAETAASMSEGGVVFANVIGSLGEIRPDGTVGGEKHRIVGGALRSFRAAGLPGAWVIPVLNAWDSQGAFRRDVTRNVILVAARHELSPRKHPAGWERLAAFVPFPELAPGVHVSRQVQLADANHRPLATWVPAAWAEEAISDLGSRLRELAVPPEAPPHTRTAVVTDRALVERLAAAVRPRIRAAGGQARGWEPAPEAQMIIRREMDWVRFPRETWRVSLAFARDASRHDPDALVGPVDGPERESAPKTWYMLDAPLFTDQTPNADILNR
jgi:hypothetical protein